MLGFLLPSNPSYSARAMQRQFRHVWVYHAFELSLGYRAVKRKLGCKSLDLIIPLQQHASLQTVPCVCLCVHMYMCVCIAARRLQAGRGAATEPQCCKCAEPLPTPSEAKRAHARGRARLEQKSTTTDILSQRKPTSIPHTSSFVRRGRNPVLQAQGEFAHIARAHKGCE